MRNRLAVLVLLSLVLAAHAAAAPRIVLGELFSADG